MADLATRQLLGHLQKVISIPDDCTGVELSLSMDRLPQVTIHRSMKAIDSDKVYAPGGHLFVKGICDCGQTPSDDPGKCPIERV